ncbi:MAG: histidine phosphatase family protein [Desulfobulbaceae bacterium]|nr:MAG: histidine phosphatase family protein [Desulfobulbaceae bacterium]
MKQLYLVRHAKSSWSEPSLADFDRPLNKRGKRNAPFMGKRLRDKEICPDLLISSGAKRARKTAGIIAREIGYPKDKIVITNALYTADMMDLLEIVREMDKQFDNVMLVGHNYVITEFAEWLTGTLLGNIPTSGIACIQFDHPWKKVSESSGSLLFFDYPKLHEDGSKRE